MMVIIKIIFDIKKIEIKNEEFLNINNKTFLHIYILLL